MNKSPDNTDKEQSKPWQFKSGVSGNPSGSAKDMANNLNDSVILLGKAWVEGKNYVGFELFSKNHNLEEDYSKICKRANQDIAKIKGILALVAKISDERSLHLKPFEKLARDIETDVKQRISFISLPIFDDKPQIIKPYDEIPPNTEYMNELTDVTQLTSLCHLFSYQSALAS